MALSSFANCWLRMMASVLAIRFPWLTMTKRGTPVEPEVAINAARSESSQAAGGVICWHVFGQVALSG